MATPATLSATYPCARDQLSTARILCLTPRGFGAGSPDRRQHGQHVGSFDAVDTQAAEGRQGVALERLHPRVGVLVIPPARLEHRVSPAGGHRETGDRGPSLFGDRVASRRDGRAIFHALLACRRKADVRISSQTDIAALAVDRDSLDPALGPARGNGQVQRSAVSLQPSSCDGFDFRCCQFSHAYPTRYSGLNEACSERASASGTCCQFITFLYSMSYGTNLDVLRLFETNGNYRIWWRRRESNPRPRKATAKSLHA